MSNRDKQSLYVKQLEYNLSSLLRIKYNVYKFMNYGCFGDYLGFIIFYKTLKELKYNEDSGINERVKQLILNELRSIGYDKDFSMDKVECFGYQRDAIVFEFDSYENLLKNYAGSYMYRLHDGSNDLCIKK